MVRSFLLRSLFSAAGLRVAIAALSVALSVWMQWMPLSGNAYFSNEWLRDQFVRLHASDVAEPRIVVVDIDEASLAAAGPWPWPRERLAALIETLLSDYGVRGVALDMVLAERADGDGDMRLAMLAQHGPVVMAQAFDYAPRSIPLRVGALAGGAPASDLSPSSAAVIGHGYIANHAGLAQAARVGNIGFVPDADGMLRRLPLQTAFEGREYATLSLALFDCCSGAKAGSTFALPVKDGFARVPFSRDWAAYTVVPASDILSLRAPVTAVSGRLVLIGSSALGLSDRVATPLSPSTSGVLVHAALLSALLDEGASNAASVWPGQWMAVIFSLLVAALAVYTFPRLSAITNVALLGGTALAWLGLAYALTPHDPYFSVAGPLLSILFLLIVAVPFDWQVSQGKSRALLGTLRQYVAKSVVDELLRSKVTNPLAPVQRNVTTLIADMEGYTGQVESLAIEDAAQLTRDFLDCLTRPVLEMGGTLDKYTGDGLVAFWGAPLPIDDHADLALDAAQHIVQEVRNLSRAREQAGKPPLRARIGIESGIAMAGDFGTSFRSIYTAVGDSVNVASRLQETARNFPYDIIVGQGTVSQSARHRFKLLGEVALRGKGKPTTIYTPESSGSGSQ
ncbi:MAG TPA: adenylate/guanylate cyclase domain-containing protein [Gallionellaceae bacterium]|nr:adenylate/guanylate cyclase domain-containing protein [Gallionellaceae bacterium]